MALALGLAFWLIRSASRRAKEVIEERQQQQQLALSQGGAPGQRGFASVSPTGELIPAQGGGSGDDLILVEDIYTSKLSPEAKARLKAKQQMLQDVRDSLFDKPKESAELLRTWLIEDEKLAETEEAPVS